MNAFPPLVLLETAPISVTNDRWLMVGVRDFTSRGGGRVEDAILNLVAVAGSLTLLVEVSHIPT